MVIMIVIRVITIITRFNWDITIIPRFIRVSTRVIRVITILIDLRFL